MLELGAGLDTNQHSEVSIPGGKVLDSSSLGSSWDSGRPSPLSRP